VLCYVESLRSWLLSVWFEIPRDFVDYQSYMGSSLRIWSFRRLFLNLCSYNLDGSVTCTFPLVSSSRSTTTACCQKKNNNNGQLHKKHIIPVAAKDQEPSPNCLFLHCLFIQFQSTYPAGPVAKLFDGGVHTGENTRATRIVTRTSNRLSIVFVSTFSITMFLLEPPRYFSWENESARNKLLNSKDSSKKKNRNILQTVW
jgi:hypothetical protein